MKHTIQVPCQAESGHIVKKPVTGERYFFDIEGRPVAFIFHPPVTHASRPPCVLTHARSGKKFGETSYVYGVTIEKPARADAAAIVAHVINRNRGAKVAKVISAAPTINKEYPV